MNSIKFGLEKDSIGRKSFLDTLFAYNYNRSLASKRKKKFAIAEALAEICAYRKNNLFVKSLAEKLAATSQSNNVSS